MGEMSYKKLGAYQAQSQISVLLFVDKMLYFFPAFYVCANSFE